MIACPNCAKENQDHYKFCLGCGSDLPRAEKEEKRKTVHTPPTGLPAASEVPAISAQTQAVEAQTDAPAAVADEPIDAALNIEPLDERRSNEVGDAPPESTNVSCATCGADILPGFAFCGACGTPLTGARKATGSAKKAAIAPAGARLVLIQPDGSAGGHVELPTTEVAVGRDAGGFFGNDPFLSPIHAILRTENKMVHLRDPGSLNGIFVKVEPDSPVQIRSGDLFRVGQELILFEEIDRGSTAPDGTEIMGSPIAGLLGRISLVIGEGRIGNSFTLSGESVIIGRERGNFLFPEDGYVSGIHAKIATDGKSFTICDLGSSNGTFIKITEETEVPPGAFILMGQQLFRVEF